MRHDMETTLPLKTTHRFSLQNGAERSFLENLLMENFSTLDRAERACIVSILEMRACKANIKATLIAMNAKKAA